MERQRLAVTKRVGIWGSVYIIGGTEADGEALPAEQADDLIARFEHEQALFFPTPSLRRLPLMQCDVDDRILGVVNSDKQQRAPANRE